MLRGTDKFLIKSCLLKMRSILCVVTVPFCSGINLRNCSFSQHAEIREYTGESSCVHTVIMYARKNSPKLWIHKKKIVYEKWTLLKWIYVRLVSKQLSVMSPYSHIKNNIQIVIFFVLEIRLAMIYLQLPAYVSLMVCNSFSVSTARLLFT